MEDNFKEVWELIKPRNKNGYLEIRFTPAKNTFNSYTEKFEFFNNLEELKKFFKELLFNKVSVFVNNYNDFFNILNWKNGYFLKHGKCCYGVSERFRSKDGSIDGSYNSLKYYRFIFFDIEKEDHSGDLKKFEKKLFEDYIKQCIKILERYNLFNPSIISSGVGVHLLFRIPNTPITMGRRRWIKHFLKEELFFLNNNNFVIDGLHDATRVLGLPLSWNVKRGKKVSLIKKSDYINYDFNFRSLKTPKIKNTNNSNNNLNVVDSLEFKILCKPDVPVGNRHNTLVFALKLILRDTRSNYINFQKYLSKIYGFIDLNYNQGVEGKNYSKGIVLKWCRENISWLKKYPDLMELYNKYKNQKV